MDPKPGDRVKIIGEETTEGILMPRPPILEKGITIIKLDNGYNVGISNKKIKKIELIEKYKKEIKAKVKIKHKKSLPTIAILSFGGTISSRIDYKTGGVYADYTAEDFLEFCPELKEISNLKAKKIMNVMSEDLNYKDWIIMAKEIAKELNSDVKGVVVTQGTDTLHFSTAAVSFFLRNLNKPVIFTAAQRSIDRGSSDAYMNLICSAIAAKLDYAEVMSCMHGSMNDDYCLLIRGTKVRKMHTSRRDAFKPINELPIAKVFPEGKIEILNKNCRKRNNSKVETDCKFEEKVALITVYPNMNPDIIDFYLDKGYKGIVLAGTALGHVPIMNESYSLMPGLKKASEKDIPVVIASQTLYGRVHPYVYTNLRKLSMQLKVIFVEDMLPEVAYIKLGWVLGHTDKLEEVRRMMLTNYAGEISICSNPKTFG